MEKIKRPIDQPSCKAGRIHLSPGMAVQQRLVQIAQHHGQQEQQDEA